MKLVTLIGPIKSFTTDKRRFELGKMNAGQIMPDKEALVYTYNKNFKVKELPVSIIAEEEVPTEEDLNEGDKNTDNEDKDDSGDDMEDPGNEHEDENNEDEDNEDEENSGNEENNEKNDDKKIVKKVIKKKK